METKTQEQRISSLVEWVKDYFSKHKDKEVQQSAYALFGQYPEDTYPFIAELAKVGFSVRREHRYGCINYFISKIKKQTR